MTLNKDTETKRHSLSHILAMAILEFDPKAKLGIGPAIENGFYYDFELTKDLPLEVLPKIEKTIRALIKKNIKFEKKDISKTDAQNIFAKQPYKLNLIKELPEKTITIYNSDNFTDLCAGPHVASTKEINPDAFKLTKIAGAYWKGDEKNKMLTRIYGVAFETKKQMNDYFTTLEEAEKRDHRVLGQKLDLFHIDELVGLGLPLWHPKGALLWHIIEDFWHNEHLKNGYQLLKTPHIGKRILWETSGHWGFYNSSMYPPMEIGQTLEEKQNNEKVKDSEQFLLKPMNCPFHVQIYKHTPKSYKQLPLRWAECGTVYRYEKKGELSGLTRVRGFTQDDAHIICRADQVEEELKKVVDFILFIYKSFGFGIENINVYLSVRDPDLKKYAGEDKGWDFTEKVLEKVAKEKKLNIQKDIGGAVFYGPKLDFKVKDILGREWQCSTLQFDFNLPERFNMSFINKEGKKERPYMLHRALFGSFERFIGILIEHYAGALPIWLSPLQATVLPIGEKFNNYGQQVLSELVEQGLRAELNLDNETLGKKILEAKTQKVPYILVVGEKEENAGTVAVNPRDGNQKTMSIADFIKQLKIEIKNKK